jgi:hypothetical protein
MIGRIMFYDDTSKQQQASFSAQDSGGSVWRVIAIQIWRENVDENDVWVELLAASMAARPSLAVLT